MPR
ncbi:BgTH12-05071 [Blumeria graminis f. sp. triticale]|jgi:hypothetical protein